MGGMASGPSAVRSAHKDLPLNTTQLNPGERHALPVHTVKQPYSQNLPKRSLFTEPAGSRQIHPGTNLTA
jgi:hypothetical protein